MGTSSRVRTPWGQKATHAPQCMHLMGLPSFPRDMAPIRQASWHCPQPVHRSLWNTTLPSGFLSRAATGHALHAGRIVAPPTNHDAEVSLYPALGLDLDRTVLERYVPGVNATTGEHAAQTANASLRVRNFKPASLLGLWPRLLFWRGLCRLDLYLGIIRHTQIGSLAVFSAEIFVLLIRIAHTTKTNAKN